ncbi:MAG: anti-sigma factor antagonist [Pedosphaera sp.]|nr:anti-sigma factor antagonist [Pedosphaera sp.]
MNTVPAAQLSICLQDHTAIVKISGRANFATSVDFKKLIPRLQERGATRVVLDLTDCQLMDSTFLGILASVGFQTAAARPGPPLVELFHPNQRITDLIDNLGVSHLFETVQLPPPVTTLETVTPDADPTRLETTHTCLQAHQRLMQANPANIAKFKDVAQYLADDLQKQQTGPDPDP